MSKIFSDIINELHTDICSNSFNEISNEIDSKWDTLFPSIRKENPTTNNVIRMFADMINFCSDNMPFLDSYDDIIPENIIIKYFYLDSIKNRIYKGIKQLKDGEKLLKKIKVQVAKDTIAKCTYSSDDE